MADISAQNSAVLEALSTFEPKTIDEVAESLGVGYWTVYRCVRELGDMQLAYQSPFRRGKKIQWLRRDSKRTPVVPVGKGESNFWQLAKSVVEYKAANKKIGSDGEFEAALTALLALYEFTGRVDSGLTWQRTDFNKIKTTLYDALRRLENAQRTIRAILAVPAMDDIKSITEVLWHDPENPITYAEVEKLVAAMSELKERNK